MIDPMNYTMQLLHDVIIMLTTLTTGTDAIWTQFAQVLGLTEYATCGVVNDLGSAILRTLGDWIAYAVSGHTIGLSDYLIDACGEQ